MRAALAVLLALCCARLAGAVLQYDYLNVYSCPPQRCLARKAVPKGFAGPAASFLECRPRGMAGAGNGDAGPTKPAVANAVYSPAALSAANGSAAAEMCAPGALGAASGGGGGAAPALLVPFGAEAVACAGAPQGTPLPLDGSCRAAPPGDAKPFRRDTLLCITGANATAEACDDAACTRGCVSAAPVASAPNACRDGALALCAALAPRAGRR